MKMPILLAVTSLLAGIVSASDMGPGSYRGEYEVDRWGRHLFANNFVSPEAVTVLQPYRGKSVEAHVTVIDQKNEWGPVTILTVDAVKLMILIKQKGKITCIPCSKHAHQLAY